MEDSLAALTPLQLLDHLLDYDSNLFLLLLVSPLALLDLRP